MLTRLTQFLIPHTELIGSTAVALLAAAIARWIFGPPAMWEYIVAGIMWVLMTGVLLLDFLDEDE